jgi:hypothetical protein
MLASFPGSNPLGGKTRTHYGFGPGRSAPPALRAAKPSLGFRLLRRKSGAYAANAILTDGGVCCWGKE